jgi:PAS domain S-box-containing protein
MRGQPVSDSRAVIQAHQERVLVTRGRFIAWLTIAGFLLLWGFSASRLFESAGAPAPLVNSIELCILLAAVTQVHRPWCRRHIVGLSAAICAQLAIFLALYGLWTRDLGVLSLRLSTLTLVTAAILPWGITAQSVVVGTSTLAFAFVLWSVNGTLDHPSTIQIVVQFACSLPIALWLKQAHADLATESAWRHTAETALRQATESAKVAVWTSDLRTLKVRFASGWKRLLGRDEGEITLARLWDLVHPDDRTRATAAVQEHLQRRAGAYETEQRMLHADGSYRWVLSRGIVSYDAEGVAYRLLGADIDITERKQLEEALRCSEEKYRQLVEDIGEIIYTLDVTGTVNYISPVAESVYGFANDEVVGRPFTDFLPAEDVPALRQGFFDALSGKPYVQDHRLLTKAGDIRWVRNSTRVVIEDAQATGLCGVLTDVTDRRRIEQELRALTEELDARVIERTRQLSEALDQRKRAQERANALLQITTRIAGTLDRDVLLDEVQRRVAEVLPCDAAVTLLLDPTGETLRVASHHGVQPNWHAAVSALEFPLVHRFGEGVASGEPLVINDFSNPGVLAELAAQVPIGALAAVTLRVRGQYFGRLCAARGQSGAPFSAADVEILSGIA